MDSAFRRAVAEARRHGDLYFAALLSEDRILAAFGKASSLWQGWIYSPAVTVWVFLAQCLSADHSCRDAVAALIAWRLARGQTACSASTGAYCTARDNVPEEACLRLMRDTGRRTVQDAPAEWRWRGHRVLDVDGSTFTMPDTPQNQAEYPQMACQKRGCGFPIARIVVVFSLAVGTVLEAALGKYQGKQTGENSLFRTLHPVLEEGDVVLADRYFSGWFDLALVRPRGAHVVVHKHQLRPTDFRKGQRLGPDDQLVCSASVNAYQWASERQLSRITCPAAIVKVRVSAHLRIQGRWMKVFISWSGRQSHAVANALREWLPMVIPDCKPWASSADISAGARWFPALMQELESSQFCVICLTPDNLRSPWLYFEAGAISTQKGAMVCGLMTGLSLSQVPGPFAQFQCVQSDADGLWSLVKAINASSQEKKYDERQLTTWFAASWPRLRENLREALLLYDPRSTPTDAETEQPDSKYKLSDEAKELLTEASADKNGIIMMARTMSGLILQTNERQMCERLDARAEAKWQGAVRELVQQGLIEGRGHKGEVFNVTAEGYRVADELKAKKQ